MRIELSHQNIEKKRKSGFKNTKLWNFFSRISAVFIAVLLFSAPFSYAQTGTWTALTNLAPHENMGVMLLLTNGTVMCHDTVGGTYGKGWDLLTPDIHGSYVNGTWTTLASMNNDRLFFSSQVLPSGKVYAAGGEYGPGGTKGEVYDPVANTWTNCGTLPGGVNIYDGNSELLYNGNVLEGAQIPSPSKDCFLWSPITLNYTATSSNAPLNHDEAEWVKLPDSTVLYVGIASSNSCRYQPATDTWITDGTLPVSIYDPVGEESGCGFMLPNDKAVFFGATQHNAIYTPSGNSKTVGTWAAASDFPTIGGSLVGQEDASGAMMVNGHILLAVSPLGEVGHEFRTPAYFVEYDYNANTFTQVTATLPFWGADSLAGVGAFQTQMLDLPDGNVLVSVSQIGPFAAQYYIYTPGSAAIAQGKPVINSILPDGCPNYKITGKLFNGISDGAAYGDDWQMSTDWPIVRLTNGTNVYYATTSNWNRIGAVRTDSLEDTAVFTPPASLPSGTYSLVVVVNGFASSPVSFTTLGVTTSHVNALCNGGTGSGTAIPTGGLTPYTYSWSGGGGTNATATITAGTYTVTLTDNNGCTATASVTITQPSLVTAVMGAPTDPVCNGGTGSATVTAGGGVTPYTYSWAPNGGNGATGTGLTAGSYTVTVKDNNGCSATASVSITQPTLVTATMGAPTYPVCNGGTGTATVTAGGGKAPYTYSWAPNGGIGATGTGLTAGSYTVTVKDNNGCSATASVSITQPTSVTATMGTPTDPVCNGGTGTATVTAGGGVTPYTYSWAPNGGIGATGTGLTAGSYTVTVKDNNGCSATASVSITQPAIVTATMGAPTYPLCNGGTGTATVTAGGGVTPYTYSWAPNGGNGATGTGLTAGSYTMTVKDNNGCSATASVNITQPTLVTATMGAPTYPICNGGTGTATVTAGGGTSPYTYSWAPNGGIGATGTGLTAGSYTVTVKDNNGCSATASVSITQPTLVTATMGAPTYPVCNGGIGTATVTAGGGKAPYTYSWAPNGGIGATGTGLTAGSYTVTVKDNNGCSATASVSITQPTSVTATMGTPTYPVCNGGTGTATVTAGGGTSPYTYTWAPNGGNGATGIGLTVGSYTVTVKDNNGCSATASVTITQPALLGVTASVTAEVSCNGGNNGSVSSSPSGGTTPYTYSWTGGSTNSTETGLSIGTYTITLHDHCGASATASVSITQPTVLTVFANVTANVICKGSSTGSVSASPGGGIIPYTYSWTGGGTNSTETGLSAGTYTITLHDNNGCSATASATITQPAIGVTTSISSHLNIHCAGSATGNLTAAAASGGTAPYTYSWSPSGGTNLTASNLSAGTYTITATDNNGCSGTAAATITQPPALIITTDSMPVTSTTGLCNGEAWINASGGTSPYTYSWSPGGATTDTIKNKCTGDYCCTITDNNGCSKSVCIVITNSTGVQNISNASDITIYPDPNTGSFTVSGLIQGQLIEIYNDMGQKLNRTTAANPTMHFDISDRADGIYLVRILSTDGTLVTQKKIIKTK